MIELETFLKYEKQLRNLQFQEARLSRRREKETAELRKLQQDRKAKQSKELEAAGKRYVIAMEENKSFDPQANGSNFQSTRSSAI